MARVVKCIYGHGFQIGEIVTIKRVRPLFHDYEAECSNGWFFFVTDRELEIVDIIRNTD